jgi:hypothetical protein
MLRKMRPSPAMVVAMLSLALAVGGTSYAAVSLPKKSVGTPQLKNNAVTSPKLKNGSVTGAKLKQGTVDAKSLAHGSITAAHVAPDSLTGGQINESTLGTVPSAATADSAGIQSLTYTTASGSLPAHMGVTVHGDCPGGLRPISGGLRVDDPSTMYIVDGYPQGNGWTGNVANPDDAAHGITGYVVCAQAGANAGPAPKTTGKTKVKRYRLAR